MNTDGQSKATRGTVMKHLQVISKKPLRATTDLDRFVNILTFIIQILTAFETLFATKEEEDTTKSAV